jgi:hypothetical protein
MGQFKPMVKMETTEPSVILKLKKGGKVAKMAMGGNDFVPMQSSMPNGLAARGGSAPADAPKKPSMSERRRAMNPNFKKGGKAESKHEDAAEDRAMIKKAMAGKKFAEGGLAKSGIIMSKTGKTKMVTAKHDSAKGTSGIKEGQPAGYATGGVINGKPAGFKSGGKVPGLSGKTVEGNEGKFTNGNVVDGDKFDAATGTTGVRNGNAGGFKKGGSTKKAFAAGGKVDDGKAVKMPKHFVSRPVANSLQSGTFKKGGKVDRKAEGGLEDMSKGAYDKAVTQKPVGSGFAGKVQGAIDKFFGAKKPAGTVTETKETVTTNKKSGGKC